MDNESAGDTLACRVTDFNVLPLGALIFLAAVNPCTMLNSRSKSIAELQHAPVMSVRARASSSFSFWSLCSAACVMVIAGVGFFRRSALLSSNRLAS